MNDWMIYICAMIATMLIAWFVANLISKAVSDYNVIEPESGVKCVVVSRMFNTSVDCWKVEKPYLRG